MNQTQSPTRPITGTSEAFGNEMFGDRADVIVALGAKIDDGETTIRAHVLNVDGNEIGNIDLTPELDGNGWTPRVSSVRIGDKFATTLIMTAGLLLAGMDFVRGLATATAKLFSGDGKLKGSPFTSFGAASSERTTKIAVNFNDETTILPDLDGINSETDTIDAVSVSPGYTVAGAIGKSPIFVLNLVRFLTGETRGTGWVEVEIPTNFGGFLGILKTAGEKIVIATTRGYYVPVVVTSSRVTLDTTGAFELDEQTLKRLDIGDDEYVSGPSPIGVTVVGYTADGAKTVRNVPIASILGTPIAYLFTQLYGPRWLEACTLPAVAAAAKKAFEPIEA